MVTAAAGLILVFGITFQQRTRVIEGTWIELFEGSSFFEDEHTADACDPGFQNAPHFAFYPKPGTSAHRLVEANRKTLKDGAAVFVSKYGVWPVAAYYVRFVGHHEVLGIGFGHMGSHPSKYVVDRIISIKPVPITECDVRPA